MFSRPNYQQRPLSYNPYHPQYHNQQWNHPIPPSNPTPYQYYAKPSQPANWHTFSQQPTYNGKTSFNQQQTNGLFNYFQDKNGQMDFDKMLSTVGQVTNTVKQISPMVKQFGSIIKSFK